MANIVPTTWGVRAGELGQADSLFMQNNLLAIGWPEMNDLSLLTNSRDAFKTRFEICYPGRKLGTVRSQAGQLYRFAHEMKVGDTVIYPSLIDQQFHIGTITGNYQHDPASSNEYPNQRPVHWVKHLPRLDFTQGARYEAGSGLTLFLIRNYAHEFHSALQNSPSPQSLSGSNNSPSLTASDGTTTTPLVADNIEQITRDYILQRLGQNLRGHPLAGFVAHLLEIMGFRTRVSPPGPDGGVDIVAHKDEFGFVPPIIKVQVKSTSGTIGTADVGYLNGILSNAEHGLLITLGTFASQAKSTAKGMPKLRLIDGVEFADIVLQHYEALDPKYKGLMPLKKVFVPEEPEDQSN